MTTDLSDQRIAIPGGDALFHGMPGRMKVLYISTASRTGAWLAEAFAADSAAEIVLEEAAGQAAGMERLRDEVFDAVLVSHDSGELDALDLIEGYRGAGPKSRSSCWERPARRKWRCSVTRRALMATSAPPPAARGT